MCFKIIIKKFACLSLGFVKIVSYSLDLIGFYSMMRYIKREQALILMYHGVSEDEMGSVENFDGKYVNKILFEKQLKYFRKHYNIISLDEYIKMRRGERKTPDNPLIITFDDGYRDNLTVLCPILKKYGVKATIFLPALQIEYEEMPWQNKVNFCIANTDKKALILSLRGKKGRYGLEDVKMRKSSLIKIKRILMELKDDERKRLIKEIISKSKVKIPNKNDDLCLMSWKDINNMKKEIGSLISFGSHTLTHPMLTKISYDDMKKEVEGSKSMVENRLGMVVNHFSYPFGAYNDAIIKSVKKNKYLSAVATEYGYNKKNADLFRLKRIAVNNDHTMGLFMLLPFINLNGKAEKIFRLYQNI